jgi:hypothetical protein
MDRVSVVSSNLAEVGYDAAANILEVAFRQGGIYQYFGVPNYIFEQLMAASSKGHYFDEHVKKGGFAFRRVSL